MQAGKYTDVESLEQHNDSSLDALGDKVGLLKKVTGSLNMSYQPLLEDLHIQGQAVHRNTGGKICHSRHLLRLKKSNR